MSMSGKMTIRGVEYDISYDPEVTGRNAYSTYVEGKFITSSSWAGIQSAISTEVRKSDVTVEVPFMHPDTGKRGVATKLHAGTKRPMVTWANGGKEQIEVRSPLRPDTDAKELLRLHKAKAAATEALRKFLGEHELKTDYNGLTGLIQAAQRQAVEERDAAERVAGAVELDVV